MGKRLTKEEIIKRAIKVHGNKYDYSEFLKDEFVYKDHKQEMPIICLKHGLFKQQVRHHMNGCGCQKCSNKYHYTTEEFIQKLNEIYGDIFDYSKTKYVGAFDDVTVICKIHGEFTKDAHSLLQGHGCNKCSKKHHYTTDEWVQLAKEIHKLDDYVYTKSKYVDSKTDICVICPKHGEFWQNPYYHLKGCGCPICNESKLEKDIREFLLEKEIIFEPQKTFEWLKFKKHGLLKYDFYLPKYKVAIECQGIQHFKEVYHFKINKKKLKTVQERDRIKNKLSKENGVKLLYFSNLNIKYPYEVFKDKEELLNKILNKNESNC